MPALSPFSLPEDFLLGTATASLQIEGGDTNNSWYRWCNEGHIKDGTHCIRACDHWNRLEEDISLMQELGTRTYRLGLEWARIEPEEGRFDGEALAHYRREIELLREAGIRPLVTLHHFSNPLWMEDDGAWVNPESVPRFLRYTRRVVETLGDLVSDWVTINEPNIYLLFGYVFGEWPPGRRSLRSARKGARNMARAHAEAYHLIHQLREEADYHPKAASMVGVAHHLRVFNPARPGNPLDRFVAGVFDRLSQDMFVRAMTEGRAVWPMSSLPLVRRIPGLEGLKLPGTRGARGPGGSRGYLADFLGINYYSRDFTRASLRPGDLFGKREVPEKAPRNDLGWEIYPEGLYRVIRRFWERYRLPIFVTENGTADAADSFRSSYIATHLAEIARAVGDGVDVRRYYHWSLMDNFEWVEGLTPRFGLVEVDYATQERRIRESGRFYAEISRRRGADAALLDRYGLAGE